MKEQIEKAGKQYANLRDRASWVRNKASFIAGANFANQIWEEKTRWIPVGERLPEIKEKEYPIAAKYNEDSYAIFWIFKDCMPLCETMATHWKEII